MTDSELSTSTAIRITADQMVRVIGTDGDGSCVERSLSVAFEDDPYAAGLDTADWLESRVLDSSSQFLLLPSCEFVVHSTADPVMRRLDDKTLLFEIEPELPFDLESVVVDISRLKDSILVMALPVDPWKEFMRGLEDGGTAIRAIHPSAYVEALERARTENVQSANMLFSTDGSMEFVSIREGRVGEWHTITSFECGELTDSQLRLLPLHDSSDCIVGEAPSHVLDYLDSTDLKYRKLTETRSHSDIASMGIRVNASFPDFRKDELGSSTPGAELRRPVNLMVASVVVLIIAINCGLFLRGQKLAERISHDEATITDSYKEAFPGRRVPAGVLKRLKSEQTKLRREAGADIELEETQSALHSLVQLIDGIPQEPRVLVTRLGSEPTHVELEGYVQQPSDWQSVVEQLREQNLVIDQPDERTDETGTTWFKLTGQVIDQGGVDGS